MASSPMYVQCERCKAEYDFDDALVSERGTTVKCTNCAHQFKVRRAAGAVPEDRWVVTRITGEQVVLTSLKELQRAILAKRVAREDTLARGGGPPRFLGAIAELEPFFDEKKRTPSLAPSIMPDGASPRPPRVSSRPPPPPNATVRVSLSEPPRRDLPPMRARTPTLRPPDQAGAVPPPHPDSIRPAVAGASTGPEHVPMHRSAPPPATAPTTVRARTQSIPPPLPRRASNPANIELSSPLPPPAARRPSYRSEPEDFADLGAEEPVHQGIPPRRFGGWIAAVVLIGGSMIIGGFALRPYLGSVRGSAAQAAGDPRVAPLLASGEHALAEGDLDVAQTSFDKASAFAEKDPKVLIDLARVANARADVAWLRQRLLAAGSDAIEANKKTLAEQSDRAMKASDAALSASPEDPAALRARLDALRIHDEHDAARALAARVTGGATAAFQPEVAYVLGALDLSELDPPWPDVLERLRAALAGEGNAGRARAALVYALVRSGDPAHAREELARLTSLPHPHPLLTELRAFVDRAPAAGDAGVQNATIAASALPLASASAAPGSSSGAPGTGTPGGGGGAAGGETSGGGGGGAVIATGADPRTLLSQAEAAKQRHDFPRARSLYDAILTRNPGDSEALAGLGDVSHAERDLGGAQAFYKRALAANPSFMPALIGLADVQWESGDRGPARKSYKDIVDRFPEGSYPSYVHTRAETPAESAPGESSSSSSSSGGSSGGSSSSSSGGASTGASSGSSP